MMLAQFLVYKRGGNRFRRLGAEQNSHVRRQMLAQECVRELRIAQHLFEECIVDADDLTGHGWVSDEGPIVNARCGATVCSHSNTCEGGGELL